MAVKILVSTLGQQIIADVKVIENTETGERVAYWVAQPRILGFKRGEGDQTSISFSPFCYSSDENEFSIREDFIVSVLEPREDIAKHWKEKVYDDSSLNEVRLTGQGDEPVTPEVVNPEVVD